MSEWESEVWSLDHTVKIYVGDNLVKELTPQSGEELVNAIKAAAREAGLSKFIVKDQDGETLTPGEVVENYKEITEVHIEKLDVAG